MSDLPGEHDLADMDCDLLEPPEGWEPMTVEADPNLEDVSDRDEDADS